MLESTASDEEWELDRYGLREEGAPVSGTEDSDVEEFLYSQIHYNLADNEKVQTGYDLSILSSTNEENDSFIDNNKLQNDDGKTISDCLEGKTSSFNKRIPSDLTVRSNVRSGTTLNLRRTEARTTDLDKEQTCVDTLTEAKSFLKNSDSKYAIEKKSNKRTTNTKAVTALPCNSDGDKSCDKGNVVIDLCTSSDSDVIFLGTSLPTQKSVPLKTKQREAKLSVDDKITTVAKINRESLLTKKKRKRKRKKKGSPDEDDITAECEKNDDSDAIAHHAKEKQRSVASGKQRKTGDDDDAEKGQGETDGFFLDNKGMNLDGVKAEMTDPTTSWRQERERTKEMLRKEKGNLIRIIDSSDDDDCMAIESHSEDEGMHVHFDGKADDKTSTMENSSSGSWSEKRNRSDRKPEVRGRYFVQSRQKNVKCHNCFEVGHLRIECPKPRHIPACILCGTRGHTDKSCPDALCFNCSLPGHQSWACKIRNMRHAHCNRCDMPGHVRKMCTDHWRQYHMTTEDEVFVSPTNRPGNSLNQKRATYCSNCSKRGHRYYDCSASRFDEFTTFTYDGVAKYDNRFKELQRDKAEEPPAKRRRTLRTRDYQAASTSHEYVEEERGYYETVHSIYSGVLSMQNPGFFRDAAARVKHEEEQRQMTLVQGEPSREDDRQTMDPVDQHIQEEEEYYEAMNVAYAKDKQKDPSKGDAAKRKRKRKKSKKEKREVEWMQHDDRTSQEAVASNQYSQINENLQESYVVEAFAQIDPKNEPRPRKRKHPDYKVEFIDGSKQAEARYDIGPIRMEAGYSGLGDAEEAVSSTSCLPVKRLRKVIKTKVKAALDLDKQKSKKSSQNKDSTPTNVPLPVPPMHGQGINYPTSFNAHSTATTRTVNNPEGMPHRTSAVPQATNANQTESPQRSSRGFFLNEGLIPSDDSVGLPPAPISNQRQSSATISSKRQPPALNVTQRQPTALNTTLWQPALDWTLKKPSRLSLTQGEPPAPNMTQKQPQTHPTKDSFASRYLAMSKKQRKLHADQWNQYTDAFVVDLNRRNLWNGKTIDHNQTTAEERAVFKLVQHKFHKLRKGRVQVVHQGPRAELKFLTKKQLKEQRRVKEWNAKQQKHKSQSRIVQQVPATNAHSSAAYPKTSTVYAQDFPRNAHPSQNVPGPRQSKGDRKPISGQQKRDCFVS